MWLFVFVCTGGSGWYRRNLLEMSLFLKKFVVVLRSFWFFFV